MYLIKNNSNLRSEILPLRDVLSRFLKENEITDSAIAEEVGVTRATLSKFLKGESELKFMQAVRLMKVLGIPETDYVTAYCEGKDAEEDSLERLERISYISKNFDLAALKKLGIIPKVKVEEYEKCICNFLGINSIYEYDDTSLMPALFSKSKRRMLEEKESKMTSFWLKCAIQLKLGTQMILIKICFCNYSVGQQNLRKMRRMGIIGLSLYCTRLVLLY